MLTHQRLTLFERFRKIIKCGLVGGGMLIRLHRRQSFPSQEPLPYYHTEAYVDFKCSVNSSGLLLTISYVLNESIFFLYTLPCEGTFILLLLFSQLSDSTLLSHLITTHVLFAWLLAYQLLSANESNS